MQRSVILAIGLAIAVALWMLSGTLVDASRTENLPDTGIGSAAAAQPMRVQIAQSEASVVDRSIRVLGQLEPRRRVILRAETEGKVARLPVLRGAWVEAGAVLVELAEDDRPAQLARAEAELAARELELAASEKLGSQGMQARTQIKQTQAALASAEAELARLRVDIDRLRIRAPFAGVVETRDVELGSLVQRGDEVLELVDNSRLKAVGQVPQQSAGDLELGQRVRVALLDGTETSGRLSYLSRVADAQTRSFKIEAEIPNPELALASGVSAELSIKVGEERGHFVSPAVLTLDDDGRIGVRTVDDSDQVRFYPITLIHAQMDGVWVSGLPLQVRIITQGQGFVSEGEQVKPVKPVKPVNETETIRERS
ncbi:efflux RND transporter periplasmic adaptor subunit [Lamprobacter modestohalophilus]|uniref:efflux RND transporter periplasmic adaptor subunit n=1 Tax=Lamprobacter modestohalophilus TaxID=1064514 RepID=UPI002ADEC4D5|nr:efflux RND transporter periplasmic adaptor subunit [Lamprobacter modestohalophilus]MEA1049869.1 efflux RND transporter periplasmic adaptor subunit [Lamprobacter modestohalophilus]